MQERDTGFETSARLHVLANAQWGLANAENSYTY